MSTRAHGLSFIAMIAVLAMAFTGCVSSGPSLDEKATQLASELEQSSLGVSHADILAPSSFTGSLTVTVVLAENVLERGSSISADELERVLRVVGEGASDMRVGSAVFYAEDDRGSDVDMTQAAEQLGLRDNVSGRSLSFSGVELKQLASP